MSSNHLQVFEDSAGSMLGEAEWTDNRNLPHLLPVPEGPVLSPVTIYTRWGKRAFDLLVASVLIVVLAIPLAIIAVAVRWSSPGPAFFIQERVGQHMSNFRCYKIRTMVHDADAVLFENPQLRDALAVSWKLQNDPRVTKIGRILRPHSLDELPQLLNVLRGEMSLVGPRPYMLHELSGDFGSHAVVITSVKPGMTGLWQVSGRSHLSPRERISLDENYVNLQGFRIDLLLLIRTIKVVFNRRGAY